MKVILPPAPIGLPPLSRYFSDEEAREAHPDPGFATYHNLDHTKIVRIMAYELALAEGLPDETARFLSEVALLHDWDPLREPGTPARVPATLRSLGLDYAKKRSLALGHVRGHSVLLERFQWSRLHLRMAFCLLYRTEFPFESDHPGRVYKLASPAEKYTRCLKGLPKDAQEFVLRQAPMLAQYVDQLSWYATQPFDTVLDIVDGLINELNHVTVSAGTTQNLDTTAFLNGIRDPRTFDVDHRMAKAFGVTGYDLPSLRKVFELLPTEYGATFKANQAAFAVYEPAVAGGTTPKAATAAGLKAFHQHKAAALKGS